MELYVVYNALQARMQQLEDDIEAPFEEKEFCKSAINKIKKLGVELKLEPQALELPSDAEKSKEICSGCGNEFDKEGRCPCDP